MTCPRVIISENASADVKLEYGVSQGSVLGPKLYPVYTRPLGITVRHRKLDVHFYDDDTQLYVYFMNSDREGCIAAIIRLNGCIRDVRTWLTRSMPKLNDEKTKVIVFTSKHGLKSLPNFTVTVGEQQQQLQSSSVRDLGVIYDHHLT